VGGLLFKMVIQTCTNNKPSNHNASVKHFYARKTPIIRNIYRFTPAALTFIWLHLRYHKWMLKTQSICRLSSRQICL